MYRTSKVARIVDLSLSSFRDRIKKGIITPDKKEEGRGNQRTFYFNRRTVEKYITWQLAEYEKRINYYYDKIQELLDVELEDEKYHIKQVAKLTGVCKREIQRKAKAGVLEGEKIKCSIPGSPIYEFTRPAVKDFLREKIKYYNKQLELYQSKKQKTKENLKLL